MVATVVTEGLARRLVARRLHPLIVAAILGAVGIATWLAVDYSTGSWARRTDHAVGGRLIAHLGRYVGLTHALANLGGALPILVAMSASVIAMLALGRPRGAWLALTPLFATSLTDAILKPGIGRIHLVQTDPDVGQAYPSGHTTAFCAVIFVVMVVALDQRPRRLPPAIQVAVCGVALALAGCVGVALIAAGYHVTTDVIGGACVALATVLTMALVIDWGADRRVRNRLDERMVRSPDVVD